jgi:predicted RNA binding protein YcfA (HicA-like mRNA interferase family)
MNSINSKDTYKNLIKKGFIDCTHKSSDHKYIELNYKGKHILHTKVSHGNQDIGPDLVKAMAFQCKLSKPEFLDLAKCPMDRETYLQILKERKLLD